MCAPLWCGLGNSRSAMVLRAGSPSIWLVCRKDRTYGSNSLDGPKVTTRTQISWNPRNVDELRSKHKVQKRSFAPRHRPFLQYWILCDLLDTVLNPNHMRVNNQPVDRASAVQEGNLRQSVQLVAQIQRSESQLQKPAFFFEHQPFLGLVPYPIFLRWR